MVGGSKKGPKNRTSFMDDPSEDFFMHKIMLRPRETKIRLHHLAQIDFVIKVRECTKLRHMLIQNKTKGASQIS